MNNTVTILAVTIPSLIVFLTAYLLIKQLLRSNFQEKKLEQVLNNSKITTPIRLQAYERIILLLERISPDNLIMRLSNPNISNQDMHASLLKAIRAEYEHNLSQQVYVSNNAWEMTVNAKEQVIKLVNMAALQVKKENSSIELCKLILEIVVEENSTPTKNAVKIIKEEARMTF